MLNKLKENKLKIFVTIVVVIGFALIRTFESKLFYDPFLAYFNADFHSIPYPSVENFKLFAGLFFRYFLNSALSLLLIFILFQNRDIFKFSLFVYSLLLVLFLMAFYIILEYFPNGSWLLFYVRRFLIQPILVLLFIPGFYYQLQKTKK
ncbi:exosortase F system-associated membrane protein [Flavobacterium sharifuzzamanii]|uniref:exosortase F system-associated membrane protein n=1 Tax=Flavobacterium sharifuzzamanii TaxID=2211133 RepID=UPI000DACAB87|nr:exosortase F system-associated protein [Flavobacterium sharifuzzamanii]KAF2079540.1 exosortase F system-associated protein [Flavobacterium sharifuzzamanii]